MQQGIDHEGFDLINVGSCGLHVVHGMKEGMKNTEWFLASFLRPLCIADFTQCTGCTVFPLKFCYIRAREILPHLQVYVEAVEKQTKDENPQFKRSFPALKESRNFRVVSEALKDKMLCPKLTFFSAAASITEPFLREFQTDNPDAG
ncbi:hypothetical protein PR048_020698 [Dryococelus australis]|uniref:Uncharacterized protein n=1 Tax=Dryococelus australis TaxID=614101 RepID=A0ABQ9H769_9NEOP|nr:hypothetical protein PR048_020698 [Dryococelus australis]